MADNQLILRTADLFISPIPAIELEKIGLRDETRPVEPETDVLKEKSAEETNVPEESRVLSRKDVDPLAGDSIFFGGRLSDNSDINERKYLNRDLCAQIAPKCPDDEDVNYIWNTVWRVSLRANTKEQVGLFRFCGPQHKGRVGFELVIFPEYRHMGYARQLIAKMTSYAFGQNDIYFLYSDVPGKEEPAEYERILRRAGFGTEEEVFDPLAAQRIISDEEIIDHKIPDMLIKEAPVTAYSAAYIMIGLCIGMIISIYSGLMLEGIAGGLIFSTVLGAVMDHFELKHRKRVLSGSDEQGDTGK